MRGMLLLLAAILLASALSNFLLAEWWARLILKTHQKWTSHFPMPMEVIKQPTEIPQTFASLTLGIKATALFQAVAGTVALILALK